MRRVASHVSAAVGAGLFNCYLAGGRSHRNKLFGHNLGIFYDFAVKCDCSGGKANVGIFQDHTVGADGNLLCKKNCFSFLKVLDHTSADQQNGNNQIQRKQNTDNDSCQINPEMPKPSVLTLIKLRMEANSTAMPVAADRKFCTVNPTACVR